MDFPTLETERLLLREWQDEDAPNILEIFHHEDVARYISDPPYRSVENAMRRVLGSRVFFHEKNAGITWGIFDKKINQVLGDIDFTYNDGRDFKVMLGCSALHRMRGGRAMHLKH